MGAAGSGTGMRDRYRIRGAARITIPKKRGGAREFWIPEERERERALCVSSLLALKAKVLCWLFVFKIQKDLWAFLLKRSHEDTHQREERRKHTQRESSLRVRGGCRVGKRKITKEPLRAGCPPSSNWAQLQRGEVVGAFESVANVSHPRFWVPNSIGKNCVLWVY